MLAKPLFHFLLLVTSESPVPIPAGEEWSGLIERLTTPGVVNQVSEDTWDYFLDVLPPRWMGKGIFAFAEGVEPLRLFWRKHGKYFCRQLSWDETRTFVRYLARQRC